MRRDAMKAVDALEKKGDLGEDEAKALSDTVQELTDDYVKQVARLALWQVLCVCLLGCYMKLQTWLAMDIVMFWGMLAACLC